MAERGLLKKSERAKIEEFCALAGYDVEFQDKRFRLVIYTQRNLLGKRRESYQLIIGKNIDNLKNLIRLVRQIEYDLGYSNGMENNQNALHIAIHGSSKEGFVSRIDSPENEL